MKSDSLIHHGTAKAHDANAACWCKPERQRFDSLSGKWMKWNGSGWSELPDQSEPPSGYLSSGGRNPEIIDADPIQEPTEAEES